MNDIEIIKIKCTDNLIGRSKIRGKKKKRLWMIKSETNAVICAAKYQAPKKNFKKYRITNTPESDMFSYHASIDQKEYKRFHDKICSISPFQIFQQLRT